MRRSIALVATALLAASCARSTPAPASSSLATTTTFPVTTPSTTSPPVASNAAFRVASPVEGAVLAGLPVVVRGSANTFEATFVAELQTTTGDVLDHVVVHATAGTGTWGSFEVSLGSGLTVSGPETVVLYERSAKDGSPVNQLRIHVVVKPSPPAGGSGSTTP